MKQNLYSFCSQSAGSSWHFGSISHIDTSIMFCPKTTKILRITWARCILLNLRSKTQPRATLLLLTWIYFCRSGGTVNFILRFMTNVTISNSISQIFHSWVATYQLRPPVASLSHNLYDIPGPALRMDILFWGQHDFQISFSNRVVSGNVSNRHWRSVMVDTGILSNNMKFLSQEC